MSARSFILFADRARWHAAAVGADGDVKWLELTVDATAPPDEIAEHVSTALVGAGYRGGGVALLIESTSCLAASIATDDLSRHDRRAMIYRLEEKLPLAAEEIVADFALGERRALGIAVHTEQLRPIIDALESRGVAVESLAPAAMCAAQSLTGDVAVPHLLLLGGTDHVSCITIANGLPTTWSVAPANEADVALHVDVARQRSGAAELRCAQVDTKLMSAWGQSTLLDDSIPDVAARTARVHLTGQLEPWFELRRGALAASDRWRAYRRALNVLLSAAAVLLLALSGAMLVRSAEYNSFSSAAQREIIQQFQSEFPGWSVPLNVAAMVQSEHGKFLAQQAGANQQASSESALRVLLSVLGAVPRESRVILERMTFDDRGFMLEGLVAVPAQLDDLTIAIRSTGLRVAPPLTQRDTEGAWRFSLRGELAGAIPASPRIAEAQP